MGREIVSTHSYADKLIRLIPTEIVAAYLAIQNLAIGWPDQRDVILIVAAAVLVLVIPCYLRRLHSVKSNQQIAITMISFLVWVFSVSIPYIKWIAPLWSTVVIILWTVIVPVVQPGDLKLWSRRE